VWMKEKRAGRERKGPGGVFSVFSPRLAACLLSASSGRAFQAASSASAPSSLCVLCRRARSACSLGLLASGLD
jgi:hypothetical protein